MITCIIEQNQILEGKPRLICMCLLRNKSNFHYSEKHFFGCQTIHIFYSLASSPKNAQTTPIVWMVLVYFIAYSTDINLN